MLYNRPQTGSLGWNMGVTTDDTQTVEKDERKSGQLFYFVHVWAVMRYLYLCLVPVKVNKTNCHVPICGCFSSCFEFTSCAVYPTLHVCVCVGGEGAVWFDSVFSSSFSSLCLGACQGQRSWQPSYSVTLWCGLPHRWVRVHTHTQTQTKVRSRQTQLTLKALCLRLLSLEALTSKENKQGRAPGALVSLLWCALVSATCILAGWNNNPEAQG